MLTVYGYAPPVLPGEHFQLAILISYIRAMLRMARRDRKNFVRTDMSDYRECPLVSEVTAAAAAEELRRRVRHNSTRNDKDYFFLQWGGNAIAEPPMRKVWNTVPSMARALPFTSWRIAMLVRRSAKSHA